MKRAIQLICSVAALFACLCGSPLAQSTSPPPIVGFLGPTPPPTTSQSPPSLLTVFRAALSESGLMEGRDFTIESRWPQNERIDRLPEVAAELVNLRPAVVFVVGATAARAAAAATINIPIVYAVVVDPAATGLTRDPGHPEANLTGVTSYDPSFAPKQLELLKQALPSVRRIALLGDEGASAGLFKSVDDAARTVGLDASTFKVARSDSPDFERAIASAKAEGVGAVVVISTPVTTPHRKAIVESASRHGLPTLSPRDHEDASPLLSYGTSFVQTTRRAAAYVAKVLKGASPKDLPVETVATPELIVNLNTARALGLTLPPSVTARATRLVGN